MIYPLHQIKKSYLEIQKYYLNLEMKHENVE